LAAGRLLCEKHLANSVIVTLDNQGMAVVPADAPGKLVTTRPRMVYDVTGAGDMALATLGFCQASGLGLSDAAQLANVAAGLEVERLGVVPITLDEIRAELSEQEHAEQKRRVSLDEMTALADFYRSKGQTIVLANGCFDLLHVGHVKYLQEASRMGDVLVVAINSDRSVRSIKGSGRPVIDQEDRATLLAALKCVDHVLVFDAATPHDVLRRIRPDVLVKGGTYTIDEVVGREIVWDYGGRVCVTGKIEGTSTTDVIARVRERDSHEVVAGGD
jgi:D-beta-D-heptose 7-phosphate kinase/D-beta-D-heptose 1-phosphate adenosyltransferase